MEPPADSEPDRSAPEPAPETSVPPVPASAAWAGLLQALERHSRVEPNPGDLACWELMLDARLEPHDTVAALRDWSRVQRRLEQLDPADEPSRLYADLQELAATPEVAGPGLAAWLRRVLPMAAPSGAAPEAAGARGLTAVNLHLARCIHADWLGYSLLTKVRRKAPAGPLALFDALVILEQIHDPRFTRRSLVQPLVEKAGEVRAAMQAEAGDTWLTMPFVRWLESFGRHAQAAGFEGRINALNRYDACLGTGFFRNGMAIPISLCALVQFVLHRVVAGERPIRARGLNTPGHFLLLVEEGDEQWVADPFRGVYNLTWKTLMGQMGARELAALTPEALLLDQPGDILPRMCLNALKRLENRQEYLLSAEYCSLHHAVSQDPNLLLQRALLRMRGHAGVLARADLARVMQSDHDPTAKLAQKFMMREDFYLSQHPN